MGADVWAFVFILVYLCDSKATGPGMHTYHDPFLNPHICLHGVSKLVGWGRVEWLTLSNSINKGSRLALSDG